MSDFDVNGFGDYIKNLAEKAVEKQLDIVIPKVWEKAKERYDEMYKISVEQWYSAYSPQQYARSGDLLNLITTEVIGSGKNSALKYDFETYQGRLGDDITDNILIRGYHGGPNIPYSTLPYTHLDYNGMNGRPYGSGIKYKWKSAVQSTSPYDLFMIKKEQFDNKGLDQLFENLWQANAANIIL